MADGELQNEMPRHLRPATPHDRINQGGDYYKPPIAAYDAALKAAEEALFTFTPPSNNTGKTIHGRMLDIPLDTKNRDSALSLAMISVDEAKRWAALYCLVRTDSDGTWTCLKTLYENIGLIHDRADTSLDAELAVLKNTLCDAAKTAFNKAVAEDRAKNRGGITG